jgi:hypothetical protein
MYGRTLFGISVLRSAMLCCTHISTCSCAMSHITELSSVDGTEKATLQSTVSRPIYLDVKPHLRPQDHILVTVRQLRVCWCGTPSQTRGRVSCLQLLLVLAREPFSGTRPARLMTIFVSYLRLPQPGYPSNIVAQLYPQHLVSFRCLLRPQGYGGGTGRSSWD